MALDPEIASLMGDGNAQLSGPGVPQVDPEISALMAQTQGPPQKAAVPTKAAQPLFGVKDVFAASPEEALHLASGMLGSTVGGLGSLIDAPLYAAGVSPVRPDKIVQRAEDALTYRPRTAGGQAMSSVVNYLPGKLNDLAQWAGSSIAKGGVNAGLSPGVAGTTGGAVTSAINLAPMLLGAKLPKIGPTASIAANVSPEVAAARSVGIRLSPTEAQVPGGQLGRIAESLSGSPKLERNLSRTNAGTVTQLAGQDIGIPAGQPVTKQTVAAQKAAPNAVYNQVSRLGQVQADPQFKAAIAGIRDPGGGSFAFDTPQAISDLKQGYGSLDSFDAGDAVAKIRQLRRDSSSNIGARYNPQQQSLGYAQRQVASAIEDQLQRHIASQPPGTVPADLLQQYQDARVQLAKINTVEQALKAGKGEAVSARNLAKQQDKGAPLSGNAATIANAYGNFPRALQDLSAIRNPGPFDSLDLRVGGPLALLHPSVAAPIVAAPIARAFLGSRPYQNLAFGSAAGPAPSFPSLMRAARAAPVVAGDQQQGTLPPWMVPAH